MARSTEEGGRIEYECEIAFGQTVGVGVNRRTAAEAADEGERVTVLELCLGNHVAGEADATIIETPLSAAIIQRVGEDLASTNGVAVNGRRTPSTLLRGGDVISLGGVELRFEE